ncbi:MAG: T9SS type A sorting domain-containing protein, partial [Chitinophagaceae bacterium]
WQGKQIETSLGDIRHAWYDGMDIMYKLSTPNVMAFRSALQTGIISNPFNKGVYPNPVSTALHVNGAIGEQYRITDVTGRELAGGNIPSNNTLNVGQLAVGTYMLFVSDASGKVQITKFTKN